jgi:putative flavoprotein involved in K+ transport
MSHGGRRPTVVRIEISFGEEAAMASERVETVIVGGGQAGLAAGYHLKRLGREAVILDAGARVGDSWRTRWDSLRLYSPARNDGLPGMPFPAPATSYPTTREMGDYLEAYAQRFELDVRSETAVGRLLRDGDRYIVEAGATTIEAEGVVVATGTFQRPVVPDFASQLDPRIRQLHSYEYRSLDQLQQGAVLVVGAAHSGADIAFEAASAHPTILSGRHTGQIPASIETRRGRLVFQLLLLLSRRVLTMDTPIGRKMQVKVRAHGGPLLRVRSRDLRAAGVERVLERTVGVEEGRPKLADGRVLDVANVVWCTGFRPDYGWIGFPFEIGEDGYPVQVHGVSSSPGLYFVGLPFLHSFSSTLVAGAGRDAERVARAIASRMATRTTGDAPTPAAVA